MDPPEQPKFNLSISYNKETGKYENNHEIHPEPTTTMEVDAEVTAPTEVRHRVSVTFNKETGKFEGVPNQLLQKLIDAGSSIEEIEKDPIAIRDFLYSLDFDEIVSPKPNAQPLPLDSIRLEKPKNRAETAQLGADGQVSPVEIGPYWVMVENFNNATKRIGRTRSNHVIVINNFTASGIRIQMNQKLRHLIFTNCNDTTIQILDSVVIGTRTCEIVNCKNLTVQWDMVEISTLRVIDSSDVRIQFTDNETLSEDCHVYWQGCSGKNKLELIESISSNNPNESDIVPFVVVPSSSQPVPQYPSNVIGQTVLYLGKTLDSTELPADHSEYSRTADAVMKDISEGLSKNKQFKEHFPDSLLGSLYEEEFREMLDTEENLINKVKQVAELIRSAKHVVLYTGAGVSTSASIPDYRGPTGVWTVRDNGSPENYDPRTKKELDEADPTYTHYAITHLIKNNICQFLCSTNLDGLHRRSGTPAIKMAEVHGNAYLEFCDSCGEEYLRSYSVLKTREDRWTHLTGRNCSSCGGALKDTIAHFTENLPIKPWKNSVHNARIADVALVLGTSMNVQPAASLPYKTYQNGGKLIIVNLQRTPYDDRCSLKIYAKVDDFMRLLLSELNIKEEDVDFKFDLVPELERREAAEEAAAALKKKQQEEESMSKMYTKLAYGAVFFTVVAVVTARYWNR